MTPRRRSHKNRDLPPNLYPFEKGGVVYYRYRNPQTRKMTYFPPGTTKAEAVDAAKQLNTLYAHGRNAIAAVMGHDKQTTVGGYIEHYLKRVLPGRRINGHPLSPEYIKETTRILNRIAENLGPRLLLKDVTQKDLAFYLNALPSAEAHNQHRTRLVKLYSHAVSDGIVSENVPEKILKRDKEQKSRKRLTVEQYDAIFAHARPAIQNAMELSLNALQRRADIQKWRFSDSDDGFVKIIQSKTRKHGPSAYIRIPLNLTLVHSALKLNTLAELIEHCRDDTICPFVIHEKPEKARKSKEKEHLFQLTRSAISHGFSEARDATGLFDSMKPSERPTYHELLSLGEHLREKQGWDTKAIQALRGHTTERMTQHYLDGHTWQTIVEPQRSEG